jgi:hypothetical protein
MRAEKSYRVEFNLDPAFREDKTVIDYLEKSKNKSRECRAALFDYVLGSRYAQQQTYIKELEHELEVLRRVVETLTQVNSK